MNNPNSNINPDLKSVCEGSLLNTSNEVPQEVLCVGVASNLGKRKEKSSLKESSSKRSKAKIGLRKKKLLSKRYRAVLMDVPYATVRNYDLMKHQERMHERRKDYECPNCQAYFASANDLKNHIDTHNPEEVYLCGIDRCQEKFATKPRLRFHKEKKHTSKKLCGIDGCSYETSIRSVLKNHKLRMHEGRKDFKCPICKLTFASASNLSEHKDIHNTEAIYVCGIDGCQEKFKTRPVLYKHRKKHKEQKEINFLLKKGLLPL